jgi:hypothetical protein
MADTISSYLIHLRKSSFHVLLFRGLRNIQPMISWSSHSIAVSAFAQAAHNARHCAMLPGSSDLLALVSQR